MPFYLFKDSFQRYKVASSSDADLLANVRQRYTAAGAFTIDTAGGIGPELQLTTGGGVRKTTPHSSRWVVGFRYRWSSPALSNSVIYELKNNSTLLCDLQQNADGTLALRTANGATVLGVTDRSLFSNTRYYIELDITLSAATPITCTAELRINGHVEASGSASANVNASSLLSGAANANSHGLNAVGGGVNPAAWFTDLYIKNEAGYEGDIRNDAAYPDGDGGTLDWTPNSGTDHFSRVNSHPLDLTKFLSTGTPGDIDLWTFTFPSFSGTIPGINISALAKKDDEGTKSFKIVVGTTGTDAESDEFFVSSDVAEYYEFSLKLDPATGNPFIPGQTLTAGVKLIS